MIEMTAEMTEERVVEGREADHEAEVRIEAEVEVGIGEGDEVEAEREGEAKAENDIEEGRAHLFLK